MVSKVAVLLLIVGPIVGTGVGYGITFATFAPQLDATRAQLSKIEAQISNVSIISALSQFSKEIKDLSGALSFKSR